MEIASAASVGTSLQRQRNAPRTSARAAPLHAAPIAGRAGLPSRQPASDVVDVRLITLRTLLGGVVYFALRRSG